MVPDTDVYTRTQCDSEPRKETTCIGMAKFSLRRSSPSDKRVL